MNQTPTFSLLHASIRPDGWQEAHSAWMQNCDNASDVEYILAVDDDFPMRSSGVKVIRVPKIGSVPAWNEAARVSTGKVLVVVADDFFPCAHWDSVLLAALPFKRDEAESEVAGADLEGCYAIHVDAQDPWPQIMTHPILTRAYYEKPGRGGHPNGELFNPDYICVGSDDDFTLCAWRDGVTINAKHLKFEHRHPAVGKAPEDAAYQWENRPESWKVRNEVLHRRLCEMFGIGSGPQRTITVLTPGADFSADWLSEWDVLHRYLLTRYGVGRGWAVSNNIYMVRENIAQVADQEATADYILWIDSDNPPKVESFRWLEAAMRAAEGPLDGRPPVDIIGAWYRYSKPDDPKVYIAAGKYGTGERDGQISEEEVLAAKDRNKLMENIAYIGFGMLLMRGSVLKALGPEAFWAANPTEFGKNPGRPLTDDVSWCERARKAGYRIYLHPRAFVEHLKRQPVPPARTVPVLKDDGLKAKEKEQETVTV